MWQADTLVFVAHVFLVALLIAAAWQDFRKREVSNWISIPVFVTGLLVLFVIQDGLYTLLFIVFVAVAIVPGGYGAADGKILAGLVGLWPMAVIPSVILMPLFDYWWRKNRPTTPAPLTIPIGAAALLTIAFDGSRIFFAQRLNPFGGIPSFFI